MIASSPPPSTKQSAYFFTLAQNLIARCGSPSPASASPSSTPRCSFSPPVFSPKKTANFARQADPTAASSWPTSLSPSTFGPIFGIPIIVQKTGVRLPNQRDRGIFPLFNRGNRHRILFNKNHGYPKGEIRILNSSTLDTVFSTIRDGYQVHSMAVLRLAERRTAGIPHCVEEFYLAVQFRNNIIEVFSM